jgi:hypothetical protein
MTDVGVDAAAMRVSIGVNNESIGEREECVLHVNPLHLNSIDGNSIDGNSIDGNSIDDSQPTVNTFNSIYLIII